VISGNRPPITLQQKANNDPKLEFMLAAIESCWNQDPNRRSSPKHILKNLKTLMESETYPYLQTNI